MDKARAFHGWLGAMKSPEDQALFDQSDVEGLLLLADGAPVTQRHVEQSVRMMTEAGLSPDVIGRIRRLAELLVEFERNPTVPDGRQAHPSMPPWLVPVERPARQIHFSAVSSPYAEKVEAFLLWLQSTGNPKDVALFEQTDVERLLIRAAGQPITSQHIDECVARENASGVFRAYRLGQLLMRFEAGTPSQSGLWTAADAKAMAARRGMPELTAPLPEVGGAPKARLSRRSAVAAGSMAAMVVIAGLAWWLSDAQQEAAPLAPQAPAATIDRIDALDLAVNFPHGWRRGAVSAGPAGTLTAQVFSGAVEASAKRRAFIGVLPRVRASGAAAQPPDVLRWAREAEQAAAAHVTSGDTKYVSAGCEVVAFGEARAGRCLGAAGNKRGTTWLQTWVRVGAPRAVVAIFLEEAPSPSAATNEEIERVVASLRP